MTGQLDIFHHSGREPKAADDLSGGHRIEAPVSPPAAATAKAASRPEPHDHAGQPGDDGSLHWMLTGQPEPRKAA